LILAARVIVVGAGPAGAVLAYLLARRGVEVALLERHTDFAREFRGEVLLPGGLEPFEQMGLWEALERVPHVTLKGVAAYLNGAPLARADFGPSGLGRFAPRWMSQPALLEMLVAEAGRYPGFRLERGTTVRGLLEEGGRVVGVHALGDRELRADLVVGADGRSSAVRRRSGLRARSDPIPMDVVWCKLPLPEFMAAEGLLRTYLGHGHLLFAAPVYDGRLQMAWIIRKGSFGEIRERGMPDCLDAMAEHVSPDLAAHLRRQRDAAIEPFLLSTVSDRVESWSRPGLLVIGDAAHTMSPVGAQGLNLAVRDAVVAANRLAPVLEGGADPGALDRAARQIEAERRPEVQEIQRIQAFPPRILLRDTWWSALALRLLPGLLFSGLAQGRRGTLFRRLLYGVTEVRLAV
jgi:2-polyprenyl-6-methoxyphenol hydroxylase-like FAD-dependent oxidoreductase